MARNAEDVLRNRLRELRIRTGLSQENFAEQIGFAYKYYQSIEAGRRTNIRLRTIESLAEGFGLKLHQLFALKCPIPRVKKPSPSKRQRTPRRKRRE